MNTKTNAGVLIFSLLISIIIMWNSYNVAFAYESADTEGQTFSESLSNKQYSTINTYLSNIDNYNNNTDSSCGTDKVEYARKEYQEEGSYDNYSETNQSEIIFPNLGSPYQRCLETQTKRAKECNRKRPDDREACIEEVESAKSECSKLQGSNTQASFFCSGTCQTTKCTAQRPCTIKPPGGKKAFCSSGTKCKNTGKVCDKGTFFDCHCTQTFQPRLAICSCACE